MRRPWLKVLLAASLCLNAGFLSAFLISKVHHRREHGIPGLQLSPQVKSEFDANFAAFRERMASLHADLKTEKGKLLEIIASDNPSPEAIKAQEEKVLAANARISEAVTEHLLKQKRLLSPQEQRTFFDHISRVSQESDHRSTPPKEETHP